jgi:subtilisin family serine protease
MSLVTHRAATVVVALGVSLHGCDTDDTRVPLPTFEVDTSLVPRLARVEGIDGGPDRLVGSIVGPSGRQADVVLDELTVMSADRAAVDALAARWGGSVVKEVTFDSLGATIADHLYLVQLDPSGVDTSTLPTDLSVIDPGARGHHRVSSESLLQLLAIAATEAAADPSLVIGADFLLEPQGIWEGSTTDGATGPPELAYVPDAFRWAYMREHHVPEAWTALQNAGLLGNRVRILIMDGGFVHTPDYPPLTTIFPSDGWRRPNPEACTDGAACMWHATEVVSAAVGQLDNGYGGAGPGGPVADLLAVPSPSPDLFKYIEYLFGAVLPALTSGPRIINLSATTSIPGTIGFLAKPLDNIITLVRGRLPLFGTPIGQGSLVFAAAGNWGHDVDHEDCFGFCWESDVYIPCELDDAVCVGGLGFRTGARHESSNYGRQQRTHYRGLDSPLRQDNSVDLFGPYTLFVGPDPDGMGNVTGTDARARTGTSLSAPFVSGVAALVWAADPTLTADEVNSILLLSARDSVDYGLSVDAEAAVRVALGRVEHPPQIRIVAPTSGESFVASILGVDLEARARDFEDGMSCCNVTWSSDVDGVIGKGASLNHQFASVGLRHVTATARDTHGLESSASVDLTITDVGPTVSIIRPARDAVVYRGVSLGLQGSAIDELVNLCEAPTPTSWTTWGSGSGDDATIFPLHGCNPAATFLTNGFRSLSFTARNALGTTTSVDVTVNVVDPPPGPVVDLRSPPAGGSAMIGDVVLISAYMTGGTFPYTNRWVWKRNDATCPEVDLTVTPAPIVPLPDPDAPNLFVNWDTSGAASVPRSCGYLDGEIRVYITDASSLVGYDAQPFTLLPIVP